MGVNLTFFVMTRKGYLSLRYFVDKLGAAHIDFVVSARDASTQEDYYDQIKQYCASKKIQFYERCDTYTLQKKTTCLAISWRWIIDSSNRNIIVFHDSLLPRYRGFSPLVTSLVNGETELGVTAIIASKNFDEGNILLQKSCSVSYPIKIAEAIKLISEVYCELIVEVGKAILSGEQLLSTPQDNALATYSLWLDEYDYYINWELDAKHIKRFIDSVGYPFTGACSILNGRLVRVYDAEIEDDVVIENRISGKVLFLKDGNPSVVCGSGILRITQLVDNETKESVLPLVKYRSRFE